MDRVSLILVCWQGLTAVQGGVRARGLVWLCFMRRHLRYHKSTFMYVRLHLQSHQFLAFLNRAFQPHL